MIEQARENVIECARAWRRSVCAANGCNGENHLIDCPAEVTRGDLVAAVDRLDRLEGVK